MTATENELTAITEESILTALSLQPMAISALLRFTGIPAEWVAHALTVLRSEGTVYRLHGVYQLSPTAPGGEW